VDIFAHALWAAAAARFANGREPARRRVSVPWAAAWGMFPDLFAFTWPVVASIGMSLRAGHEVHPDHDLGWSLYRYSHSLVLFALIFGAVWLLRKRPAWALLAWALHILIDIPSHSLEFFPTPFLWPLSDYRFGGVSWATPWFMTLNVSALLATYLALWLSRRRRTAPEEA
jgi:hypothetical protein